MGKVTKAVLILLIATGCACLNGSTMYGFDGKAVSWCERRETAEKYCKGRGVKTLEYDKVECK